MFGQLPHTLLTIPLSEYRRLQRYYFAVKDAEKAASTDPDDPEAIDVDQLRARAPAGVDVIG